MPVNFRPIINPHSLLTGSTLTILILLVCASQSQQSCNPALCVCSSTTCTNCLSSAFFLSSTLNTCQVCDYRCATCSSAQNCLTCASGYYMNSQSSSLDPRLQCLECPTFCRQCLNATFCSICIVTLCLFRMATSHLEECANFAVQLTC